MSLKSFIKNQFIDVIQWVETVDDSHNGILAWRYPIDKQEIQYGAQLTVRDSQIAVFVNEGVVADVFAPGLYKLTTQTLPVLTALKNWDKLFESPFKSDVVFFSTKLQLGRRWGTAQPITLRDAEFGMLRLRAHGAYSYRLVDAALFYKEISGVSAKFTVDDLEEQLGRLVIMGISNALGQSKIPFLDMAGNQALLGQTIKTQLDENFKRYGLELDSFVVENISLPETLQKALDTRITVDMTGDLSRFTAYNAAQAIPLAAQNEGGMAGVGATMAAGIAMGQTMGQALMPGGVAVAGVGVAPVAGVPNAVPPTAPIAGGTNTNTVQHDSVAKLKELKTLLDAGLIEQADFDATKAAILAKLSQ